MNHVAIAEGRFHFRIRGVGSKEKRQAFGADEQAAAILWVNEYARGLNFSCGSSMDFPEEDGLPEGFDAHGWLQAVVKGVIDKRAIVVQPGMSLEAFTKDLEEFTKKQAETAVYPIKVKFPNGAEAIWPDYNSVVDFWNGFRVGSCFAEYSNK